MGRSAIPCSDPTTVWLEDLIEAMEAVAGSNEPCAPAIVKMFSHRLDFPGAGTVSVLGASEPLADRSGRGTYPPAGHSAPQAHRGVAGGL